MPDKRKHDSESSSVFPFEDKPLLDEVPDFDTGDQPSINAPGDVFLSSPADITEERERVVAFLNAMEQQRQRGRKVILVSVLVVLVIILLIVVWLVL